MNASEKIVLIYVCPLMGCIIANIMFTAPLKDVRQAVRRGTLGSLNPTPWAVMTGNCTGWIIYSFLIDNQFLYWANTPGLLLSFWLNFAAAKLQYSDRISRNMRSSFVELLDRNRKSFRDLGRMIQEEDGGKDDQQEDNDNDHYTTHNFAHLRKMALDITIQKVEAPAPHENIVLGVITLWVAVISVLAFVRPSIDVWKMVVGVIVNINLCFFYGAPLSTIFTVLKTRDSSSIHRWTMITNTACAIFWTAFGFGTWDWFIIVPNGLGAILGFIQMFLRLIIPNREALSTAADNEVNDIESSVGDDIKATTSASTGEASLRNDN